MKLRNKRTGEIINSEELLTDEFIIDLFSKDFNYFISNLDKIQEEWEDYGDDLSIIIEWIDKGLESGKLPVMINDFVENLNAWKRLKNKGLTFCGWKITDDGCRVDVETTLDAETVRAEHKYITDDLNLLFGDEV